MCVIAWRKMQSKLVELLVTTITEIVAISRMLLFLSYGRKHNNDFKIKQMKSIIGLPRNFLPVKIFIRLEEEIGFLEFQILHLEECQNSEDIKDLKLALIRLALKAFGMTLISKEVAFTLSGILSFMAVVYTYPGILLFLFLLLVGFGHGKRKAISRFRLAKMVLRGKEKRALKNQQKRVI